MPLQGTEVYDFREDDENHDRAVKLKNPSGEDRRNSKLELLDAEAKIQLKQVSNCKIAISHPLETTQEELATENNLEPYDAKESKILIHEQQSDFDTVSSTPCSGVELMDHDHFSNNGISHSHLGTIEEDAATQSGSHEQQSELDDKGCRHFLYEKETCGSSAPSPSPRKSELECALAISASNNDVNSDADESTRESIPSPHSPMEEDDDPLGKDDGSLGTSEFGPCSGNFETDNVNMTVVLYPDYVVYGNGYFTGAQQLTFSQTCVRISGLAPSENGETLNFEWGVDDLVNVEYQWFQNADFVLIKLRVLSKDADQTEATPGSSGIEEMKIGILEPNWSQQQETISYLNKKYLDILYPVQIMTASNSLSQRNHFPIFEDFETIVYPEGVPDSVTISERDVALLRPEIFVNDTVIDFYIKYLENQIQPDEKHRFYFFNSFFFRKLVDLDKDPSSVAGGRAAFQRVRKWTRNIDLFEKDYIFIPVNFNLHWTLIVICHPGEVARYNGKISLLTYLTGPMHFDSIICHVIDKDSGKGVKVPCILHLDSLKGSHSCLKNHVQSYLWEEWKEKKKETSEEISSNFLNLRFISLELPQQENTYDCGLFLLHYLELFLREAPAIFNPFRINIFSTFLTKNWFLPSEASLKRTLIQRLIFELIQSRYQEVCLPACSDGDRPKSPGCNQHEAGEQIFLGRSSPPIAVQENISNSQDHGIEMTMLPTSSLGISECVTDGGLVLREFFQSGESAGSVIGQYRSLEHESPFYHPNGVKPPVQEGSQTREQFAYTATVDGSFQDLSEIRPQTYGPECSSGYFGAQDSYNLAPNGIIDASPGRSIASDHSDGIEIIENGYQFKAIPIIEDGAVKEDFCPSQMGEMDVQKDRSLQTVRCVVDSPDSGLGGLQSGFLIEEGCHENEENHEGHEIEAPSWSKERDVKTHSVTESVVCLADNRVISDSGNMESNSLNEESSFDQKEVPVGNEIRDPASSNQENLDAGIRDNGDIVGHPIYSDSGFLGEWQEQLSEERHAAKRMRFTPQDEGENVSLES